MARRIEQRDRPNATLALNDIGEGLSGTNSARSYQTDSRYNYSFHETLFASNVLKRSSVYAVNSQLEEPRAAQ
jgi:hypothetical protein